MLRWMRLSAWSWSCSAVLCCRLVRASSPTARRKVRSILTVCGAGSMSVGWNGCGVTADRLRELDRMMRERAGLAPLPVPVPLHKMGAARAESLRRSDGIADAVDRTQLTPGSPTARMLGVPPSFRLVGHDLGHGGP
jgi:hypothetical protein